MGITTVKSVSQKLLMKKPVWAGLNIQTYIYVYLSNHIMIFRVGTEINVIFVSYLWIIQGKNPSNSPPIDPNE